MAEIIIMEDSPSLRRIITRYLRDANHNVTAYENGGVSRDEAMLNQADVLITDLSMPEIDGRQALRNIHLLRPDLPVIIMTGVERFADPVLDTAFGYLHKPFAEHELLDMIDRATVDMPVRKTKIESNIESNIAKSSDPVTFAAMPGEPCSMGAHSFCGPLDAASDTPSFYTRIRRGVARLFRYPNTGRGARKNPPLFIANAPETTTRKNRRTD